MVTAHSPVVIRFDLLGDTILLQPRLTERHRRVGRPCQLLSLGDGSPVLYSMQDELGGFTHLHRQNGPLWMRPQRLRAAWALRPLRHPHFYIREPECRARTRIRPTLAIAGMPNLPSPDLPAAPHLRISTAEQADAQAWLQIGRAWRIRHWCCCRQAHHAVERRAQGR